MAAKFALAQFAPLALSLDVGARFDSNNACHAQLVEQAEQSPIGTTPIRGDHAAAFADSLEHSADGSTNHGEFIALQASFANACIISAPRHRYGSTADEERDHEYRLVVFHGPINGQAHFTVSGQLMDRL
jgi:hypothetical protein